MSSQRRRYIAIIDDESDIVELFSEALKAAGFSVRGFDDPVTALEHLHQHHSEYLLVLTDIRMPGMDGLHLAKLIHQMDSKIRFIFMSGFEISGDIIKETQIDEFMKKPIHIAELVNLIRNNLIEAHTS
jgi:DNA-binding NtrC family response regulator